MSQAGKYSPLGLNSLGSLVQNQGLCINPEAVSYMGSSNSIGNYTPGLTINDTVLRMLVWSIRAGYSNGSRLTCYSNLISIGSNSIPVLGDSKPSTYLRTVPLNPYPTGGGPYGSEYASFGWLRLIPLQAHYEFYINNGSYSDFLSTFGTAAGFINVSNNAIDAFNASPDYLDGVYSNMNDLITADISGVSLALLNFGQDLINLGRAIDLSTIDTFGEPLNLLKILYKNKGITKAVNLALLSAGFSSEDIDIIVKNNDATPDQQKKIFAAFCVIMGEDLNQVLVTLNCQTKNISVLANLLDPKVLFPISYPSLTVPEYNISPGPTNSKTYYLIYTAGQVTSQVLAKFGERLTPILPNSLASVCDAFSVTMMQLKNIKAMNIEKFSQVVVGLEVVSDLAVNGTSIPTDAPTVVSTRPLIALGSGPQGRYTTCDFFGAMSGITYPWKTLTSYIKSLETSTLFAIYRELYLAVTWKDAAGTVQYAKSFVQTAPMVLKTPSEIDPEDTSPNADVKSPAKYSLRYLITGLTLVDSGGGYSRGNAPAPAVTFNDTSGAAAFTGIDVNDLHTPSTFGTVTNLTLSNPGTYVIYATNVSAKEGRDGPPDIANINPSVPPKIVIQAPPTSTNGGSNIGGVNAGEDLYFAWPAMSTVVQNYINLANTEIATIANSNPTTKTTTNNLYNKFGWHLTLEQNARSLGLRQEKYLPDLSTIITDLYSFMSAMPQYSIDTTAEMSAQVLEAITDRNLIGGRSLVAHMRENRNAARLGLIGAVQDNEVGTEKLSLPRINGTIPTNTVIDPFTDTVSVTPIVTTEVLINLPIVTGGPTPYPPMTSPSIYPPGPPLITVDTTGPIPITTENYDIINLTIPGGEDNTPISPSMPGPGNMNTSPYTTLIPPNLDPFTIGNIIRPGIMTVDQAIEEVILCNCDCWDNLP